MNNKLDKINLKDLRLVALKYFSKKNNGVEYTAPLSYAFLVKVGEKTYVNPFALEDNYPVLEALPYRNTNSSCNWKDYGCKLILASSEAESGPCYVAYREDLKDIFKTDIVSLEALKIYMIKSERYFKDRSCFFEESLRKYPLKTLINIRKDISARESMEMFFAERGLQLQKK